MRPPVVFYHLMYTFRKEGRRANCRNCISFSLEPWYTNVYLCPFVCLPVSVCLSVSLSLSLSLSLNDCRSVCKHLCPSVRPFVCLSVCLSALFHGSQHQPKRFSPLPTNLDNRLIISIRIQHPTVGAHSPSWIISVLRKTSSENENLPIFRAVFLSSSRRRTAPEEVCSQISFGKSSVKISERDRRKFKLCSFWKTAARNTKSTPDSRTFTGRLRRSQTIPVIVYSPLLEGDWLLRKGCVPI